MPGFPTSRFRAVLPKWGTPAIALLIFLIFRPQGLFGHMLATRRV
jgi:hypothetical protein